jgi:PAS domain S-box-containing protein
MSATLQDYSLTSTPGAPAHRLPVLAGVIGLLTVGIFYTDLQLPEGRAVVALYIVVVILAGGLRSTKSVIAIAIGCAVLSFISYFLRHGLACEANFIIRRLLCLAGETVAAVLTVRNQMLERERLKQAALLDLIGDAALLRDDAGTITWWSRGATELYGWSRSEMLGRPAAALLSPHQPPAALKTAADILGRTGRFEGELLHRDRVGAEIAVRSRWALQSGRPAQPRSILEINTDTSQARRVEAEIGAREERYRRIFHTTAAAIWEEDYSGVEPIIAALRAQGVTDFARHFRDHPAVVAQALAHVRVLDVNQTAVRMFQAKNREHLLGALDRVFLPETYPSFCALLVALAEGRPACDVETTVQTMRGERRNILMFVTFPAMGDPLTSVVVSIMDVTARRAAERNLNAIQAELARATRVATLGELTASIAREMDQPIMSIIRHGHSALAALDSAQPPVDAVAALMTTIVQEGMRAADVVTRVRSFLQRAGSHQTPFTLAEAATAALSLVQQELRDHGITLTLDGAEQWPRLTGDRPRMENAIVQLLIIGIQALGNGASYPQSLHLQGHAQGGEVVMRLTLGGAEVELTQLANPPAAADPEGTGQSSGPFSLDSYRADIEAQGGMLLLGQGPSGTHIQFNLPAYGILAP